MHIDLKFATTTSFANMLNAWANKCVTFKVWQRLAYADIAVKNTPFVQYVYARRVNIIEHSPLSAQFLWILIYFGVGWHFT